MFTAIMLMLMGLELGVQNKWFYGLGFAIIVARILEAITKVIIKALTE